MTVKEVKETLNKFFGDTNRSRKATRDGLEELKEEIELMIGMMDEEDDK